MGETTEIIQLNAGGNALLMSVNESLTAVKISLARLEERVEKALTVHGDVTQPKSDLQQVRSDVNNLEERYERERKEADERLKRTISVAALLASTLSVLITILSWIITHYKR
jgi:phosphate uptake regulator